MNPEQHTLTGAYAVGALTGDERAAFESHLAECAECAQEVRELDATAARLGAAEETAPPPRMRAAVLARISEVRQLPPDADGDGGLPRKHGDPGGGHGPGAIPLQGRRRRPGRPFSTWISSIAAAVLLAVAIALGAVSVNLYRDLDHLRAQSGEVSRVLAAPDARTVSDPVGGAGQSSRGSVVFSEQLDSAVFAATGLPAPPDGRTYQLWFVGADGARSAGLFHPDANGQVTQVLDGDLGAAQAVAFTVEPAGGSEQPTSQPLLALQLTA
jgi:Anti-sigma-K factor rskA/Putative zinc-finger